MANNDDPPAYTAIAHDAKAKASLPKLAKRLRPITVKAYTCRTLLLCLSRKGLQILKDVESTAQKTPGVWIRVSHKRIHLNKEKKDEKNVGEYDDIELPAGLSINSSKLVQVKVTYFGKEDALVTIQRKTDKSKLVIMNGLRRGLFRLWHGTDEEVVLIETSYSGGCSQKMVSHVKVES